MDILGQLFSDYTVRTVALGSAVLGVVSGVLGTFTVLRRQSLLGDAMSHAALPGIALAFLVTRLKSPLVLLMGAMVAGWIGTGIILLVRRQTRIKYDTILGIVLSVFFGLGLVLLTQIQKLPDARQAGLETFLFGQAAALLTRDVVLMSSVGLVAILVVLLLWKEFKLLSFDPEFAASLGFPLTLLDVLLTGLLVVAIVLGLQTVGVVLMSAMVVAPGAAARQWTDRLDRMTVLSAGFGALAGVSGAVVSSQIPRLPTGPTIVVALSVVVVVSLGLAPNRGLLWRWVRQWRGRRTASPMTVLMDLHSLSEHHDQATHPHSLAVLRAMRPEARGLKAALASLGSRGWVQQHEGGHWALTQEGDEVVHASSEGSVLRNGEGNGIESG
jgi:manganese/zinc/iron transport system permease protein